jgi:hypothetical protein
MKGMGRGLLGRNKVKQPPIFHEKAKNVNKEIIEDTNQLTRMLDKDDVWVYVDKNRESFLQMRRPNTMAMIIDFGLATKLSSPSAPVPELIYTFPLYEELGKESDSKRTKASKIAMIPGFDLVEFCLSFCEMITASMEREFIQTTKLEKAEEKKEEREDTKVKQQSTEQSEALAEVCRELLTDLIGEENYKKYVLNKMGKNENVPESIRELDSIYFATNSLNGRLIRKSGQKFGEELPGLFTNPPGGNSRRFPDPYKKEGRRFIEEGRMKSAMDLLRTGKTFKHFREGGKYHKEATKIYNKSKKKHYMN